MKTCLGCRHYQSSQVTELGQCLKHGLAMHYASVNEKCFESKVNNDEMLIKKCKKILEDRHAIYLNSLLREQVKNAIKTSMHSEKDVRFNPEELDILGNLTAANIKRIVDEEINNVKIEMLIPKKKKKESIIETEKNYKYNNVLGIQEGETKVIKAKVTNKGKMEPILDFRDDLNV